MSWRANHGELNKFAVGILLLKEENSDNLGEKTLLESDKSVTHYAVYFALIVIALMIIALIVKMMWNFNGDEGGGGRRNNETRRLLVSDRKVGVTLYGTNEEDLESGSEDWYDGKTCVICYDDPRNCFFIPCGHCVSCIKCAHRIVNEEIKSCPICRGMMDRIRKLRVL